MSLMFPTIFALGLKKLGANTKLGSSLLVMAIVGGAVLTPMMGLISEVFRSIALAYLVPLAAYVLVAAYAFGGSKYRSHGPAS
jgi:FHS family L-fucose permease-like MFS transporter